MGVLWNFATYVENWLGNVNFGCIGIGKYISFLPSVLNWEVFLPTLQDTDTAQLMDLCALIRIWGKGTRISLVSLSFWAVCRCINLSLIFVFERTLVCYFKTTDLWRLKTSIKKTQVPWIFLQYLDFQNGYYKNLWHFTIFFILKGHIHILGLVGIE